MRVKTILLENRFRSRPADSPGCICPRALPIQVIWQAIKTRLVCFPWLLHLTDGDSGYKFGSSLEGEGMGKGGA